MKKFYLMLVIFVFILAVILSAKPILNWSKDAFWNFVAIQFDKEEKERQQKVENGEIICGKDTILVWENMYEIGHYYDSDYLEIEENGVSDVILEKIKSYKVDNDKLYILSEEGYAVIDKSKICKVFITVSDEDFVNGYSTDEDGTKYPISRILNNEHIKYLDSYNDFDTEDKAVFEKMKE